MSNPTFKFVLAENLKGIDSDDLNKGIDTGNTPYVEHEAKSIKDKSEEMYLEIVRDVVIFSKRKLNSMHDEKEALRSRLIDFSLQLLSIQIIFLLIFLFFSKSLQISDNVLSVYMTAVLVETLGAVIVMIKYAFKSDEEVKIIDILNAVVKNFQKYEDSKDNEEE
jgi:hypothetical protein